MKSTLMKRPDIKTAIGIGMMILQIIVGGCRHEKMPEGESDTDKTAASDFYQEVSHVGKMEFGTMKVSKTITTERSAWYKVGSRIAAYSYDITLRAYIDLDEMDENDIKADEASHTIEINLPAVKVEIAGRSAELKKEYEHIGFFRSHPDSRERAELKEIAYKEFEKEFRSNPEYVETLRETASRKARLWLGAIGERRGYRIVVSADKGIKIME